MLGRLTAWT